MKKIRGIESEKLVNDDKDSSGDTSSENESDLSRRDIPNDDIESDTSEVINL
jgi:hypothetical protein